VLDTRVSQELETQWVQLGLTRFPLDVVECPDRRLERAAMELVAEAAEDGQTEVTVVLPRRGFESYWKRILHDRTADHIAALVSEIPNANATIIPFPLGKRRRTLVPWAAGGAAAAAARAETGTQPSGRRGRTPEEAARRGGPAEEATVGPGRAPEEATGRRGRLPVPAHPWARAPAVPDRRGGRIAGPGQA